MAKYDDKDGYVFPTRTGQAQGGALERKMLDEAGGASGIKTRTLIQADGTTTMLRTKNGMPRFYSTSPLVEDNQALPVGLCAYPGYRVEDASATWSKPCVITFDTNTATWVTLFKNPPQTKKSIPTPPAHNPIDIRYWSNEAGSTCLADGRRLFFGLTHKKRKYTKFSEARFTYGANLIPFVFTDMSQGAARKIKRVLSQNATSTRLHALTGEILFDSYHEKDFQGNVGAKPYDLQFPPSVSLDGSVVLMQSALAFNWGDDPSSNSSKYYFVVRLKPPEPAVMLDYTLPTFRYHSGESLAGGGTDDVVNKTGECVGIMASNPVGGGTGGFVLHCGMANPPYDMGHWIPAHQTMAITEYRGYETTDKLHQYDNRRYNFVVDVGTIIGNVARGNSYVPVTVHTVANMHHTIDMDGTRARGTSTFVPDNSVYSGDQANNETRIRVDNTAQDMCFIQLEIGDFLIKTFEHEASSSAEARAGKTIKSTNLISYNGTGYYYEGYYKDLPSPTASRNFGQVGDGVGQDPGASPPPCDGSYAIVDGTKFYDGASAGAYAQSRPMFFDQLELDKMCEVTYGDDGLALGLASKVTVDPYKHPYAGWARFKGTSRTILCYDANLEFAAYIEATVSGDVSFSAPGWNLSNVSPQLKCNHHIEYNFVANHKGVEYKKNLVNFIAYKIGPWFRPEIMDWSTWPWENIIAETHYLVQAPRIWPGVTEHHGIDNIFQHQGVCPNLAGTCDHETLPAEIIYSRIFRISDLGADWILADYAVSEGERGLPPDAPVVPYFYCPDLKPKIVEDYYQVQFSKGADGVGRMGVWTKDMKDAPTHPRPVDEVQDAHCYRV